MVDIAIGAAIPPVHNHPNKRDNQRRKAPQKKLFKERREYRADRRQCIRNAVTITLSNYPDRRKSTP